jgi:diguanylate cyclase (GGDEF)-like protein
MDPASAMRVARGLEAIIDAAAGVLAEQSLQSTLREMSRALAGIVPFTSLAVYELDHERRELVPVFAEGRYVDETLADRPQLDASITGRAVKARKLIHLEPGHPWLGMYHIPGTPADDREALVVAPLMAAGGVLGSLNVWREEHAPTFAPVEAELIRRFATLAAMAYANARQRELLESQARTDDLTGLFNRRHFHERLGEELARASRDHASVGLVLLDVDDFKQVNDGHGHAAGDETLRAFAAALRGAVRAGDVACRTGGEEFAVILPGADELEAARCARRLLDAIRLSDVGPGELQITASAGVAVAPADADSLAALFRAADGRLLQAKASGKDRVVLAAAA